jgi:hypothetical protein
MASDQSSYRRELAGILAALSVINTLANYYQLTGSIILHCDSEIAIAKAFTENYTPTLHEASLDLLKAIHLERRHSCICWIGKHIKGHQDDKTPFELLSRPSQMNILADKMAKEFLQTAVE